MTQVDTGAVLRSQMTAEENARMQASIRAYQEGSLWLYEVDVPRRLSHFFANSNALNHGHRLLAATDLPDGWVHTKYEMAPR